MCDDEGKVVGREGGEIVWRVLQEGDGGRPKKKKVPVVDEGVQPAELQQEIEMQPSEVPVYDIVGIEEYSEDEAEGDEWRDMPRTPARTPGRTPCRTLNWDAIAAIHAASFPKPDFQTVDLARSQQRLLTESQDFCAAFPETEGGLEVQASELDLPLSIDMNCEIAGLHELDAEQLRQVLAAAPATPSFTAPFATPPSRKQPLPSPAVSPCRGFEDLIDLSMFESPPRLRSPIRLATAPATPHPPVPTTPARVLFEHPERHPSVQWSPLFAGIGAEKDDDWEPRRNKIRV